MSQGLIDRNGRRVIAGLTSLVMLAFAGTAQANQITVNTTSPHAPTAANCGLQDAINAANTNGAVQGCAAGGASDAIDFSLPALSVISVASALPNIASDTQISGPGAGSLQVNATVGCACHVFIISSGTAGISGIKISGGNFNGASTGGAGVLIFGGATATLDLVVVDNNTGVSPNTLSGCGGGIQNGGTLTLTRSTVSNNTISESGGVNPSSRGGGVCNDGTLTADSDTINGNTAHADGGTTFTSASGGGISNLGAMTLERSTINGNTAEGSGTGLSLLGGGVSQTSVGSAALTSDTFGNNTSSDAGGHTISVSSPATMTIRNTILTQPNGVNTAGAGALNCVLESGSTLTSLGYNLESGNTCGLAATGDQHDTLPLLTGIADNGGPTKTRILQATSPALDAGSSFGETVDQRGAGFARPLDFPAIATGPGDGADIGAVEMPGDPFASTTPPPSTPPPTQPVAAGPTGQQAAALKKCKKKKKKKRKKCRKAARKLPL